MSIVDLVMQRVIFLDIDGVLAPIRRWDRYGDLDPACIEALNEIVARGGADVVVSSTWRHSKTVAQLQAMLDAEGFSGYVLDKTPTGVPRGESGRGDRSLVGAARRPRLRHHRRSRRHGGAALPPRPDSSGPWAPAQRRSSGRRPAEDAWSSTELLIAPGARGVPERGAMAVVLSLHGLAAFEALALSKRTMADTAVG